MPEANKLPAIASAPISVLLLAHNAEACVQEVVDNWLARLDKLERDYELVIVDDGSTDQTWGHLERLAGRSARLKLIRHPARQGDGAAIRSGLASTCFPLFFYAPCDRQYQPADLRRLLEVIDKVHLVSGYRKWRPMPRWMRWVGRGYRGLARVVFGYPLEPLPAWLGWRELGFRWMVRILFGVRLRDINCLFRLFRREIFEHIPIQSDGPFAHAEILAKANFLGCYMSDEVVVSCSFPSEIAARRQAITCRAVIGDFCKVFFQPRFLPVMASPEQSQAAASSS